MRRGMLMTRESSVKCPQCGIVNFATAGACKRCGNSLERPNALEEARALGEKQLEAPRTSAKRRVLMVGIGVAVLLGLAFVLGAIHLSRGRLQAKASSPSLEEIAPATLRS